MTKKMQAAVVEQFGKPLVVPDWDIPAPGPRQILDMAEALAFAAEGKVKADIELQPLSAINKVFERLQHGDMPSRVVLDFAGA
jgi:D-arabinose 1-dehydrogenase-like Zn-dependent alcohol dehydrogenase